MIRPHEPGSWAELAAVVAHLAEREPIDLSRLDAVAAALALPLRENPLLAAWHAVYGADSAYAEWHRIPRDVRGEPDFGWHLVGTILRRYVVPRYAFAVPGPEVLDAIRAEAAGRGVVEIGAGLGYWAGLLQHRGVDVVATDLHPGRNAWCRGHEPWCEVARIGAVTAARQAAVAGRVLFVCWPPMSGWAAQAVAAYHRAGGRAVIHVGEEGGCTGDARLWGQLGFDDDADALFAVAAELAIPQWTALDRLHICRRVADS